MGFAPGVHSGCLFGIYLSGCLLEAFAQGVALGVDFGVDLRQDSEVDQSGGVRRRSAWEVIRQSIRNTKMNLKVHSGVFLGVYIGNVFRVLSADPLFLSFRPLFPRGCIRGCIWASIRSFIRGAFGGSAGALSVHSIRSGSAPEFPTAIHTEKVFGVVPGGPFRSLFKGPFANNTALWTVALRV